ncbi:alpha/beta hydrolase [Mesorhizobium sp. YC-39]|uniref:alpha/beta hydrolase n=1 Tax=unclassified Mesorhizobium TaxID=325217 RepID=UPI0021E8010E|nr:MULTISPECIES: alpha/beta hydrolase [unclassified Mesorhizobium]MCV3211519.1 alpha/beta hydrolase [Mesorhizobium sp. YC-2]MCV3233283.1 alpha/beta hydrolase [Mesorhizobium sp. YC-39]
MTDNISAHYLGLENATVPYRKVGDHEILADIYRPKGNSVCPVIVYIHGGALITGNRGLTTENRILARVLSLALENGYALVSIDYRLAPETKLPAIASDIEAAFAWLGAEGAKRFHLDAERIVVVGDSAGGYLTLTTGYRVQPKPKGLVALYGYGELAADWYTLPNPYPNYNLEKVTEEEAKHQTDGTVISDAHLRKGNGGKIYMHYRQTGLWPQEVSGFNPEALREDIMPYEPVKNVSNSYPATMLIHGTQDTDVPFEESVKMAEQLKRHGVPCIFKQIDNGEHCFDGGDPAQIEDAYNSMREFMLMHLKGK